MTAPDITSRSEPDWRPYAAALAETVGRQGLLGDQRVLEAIAGVPRHLFVAADSLETAYADVPLPIGSGQTISQPLVVALMSEALGPVGGRLVLEVGTGSGYQAAVLAALGARVVTIERIRGLYQRAEAVLAHLYPGRVTCLFGNGAAGVAGFPSFSGILVPAAASVPPAALLAQLAVGGRMVVPVGGSLVQRLEVLTKAADGSCSAVTGIACRFVPFIEAGGGVIG
jgi:protein-L-isoaspartate(D-aspartate) O-methyltransferase